MGRPCPVSVTVCVCVPTVRTVGQQQQQQRCVAVLIAFQKATQLRPKSNWLIIKHETVREIQGERENSENCVK